jgi:hypothetical protein
VTGEDLWSHRQQAGPSTSLRSARDDNFVGMGRMSTEPAYFHAPRFFAEKPRELSRVLGTPIGNPALIFARRHLQADKGPRRHDSVPSTHVTLRVVDYLRPMTFGYLARYLVTYYNVTSNNADLGNGAAGAGDCDLQPLFFDLFRFVPKSGPSSPALPEALFLQETRSVADTPATSFRIIPLELPTSFPPSSTFHHSFASMYAGQ